MAAYFEYLRELFLKVVQDIGTFFYKGIISPWTDVGDNFATYHSYLTAYMGQFGWGGWIFWIIFLLLFIALIVGIGFLIVVFFRKYVRFVKRELDKEELKRQVERLNYEHRILSLSSIPSIPVFTSISSYDVKSILSS